MVAVMTKAQAEIVRRLGLCDGQGRRGEGVMLQDGAEVSAARALERRGKCVVQRRRPAHPAAHAGCAAFYAVRVEEGT